MTRRWPCVLITALCWVLTIAASASAECAWVLWGNQPPRQPDGTYSLRPLDWIPWGADATKEECLRSVPPGYTAGTLSGSIPTMYICLPDTIDPRGPKGK
jgi:hypothetical protein